MSLEALRAHRRTILELAERHPSRNVRVFGSTVRGDARPDSDIDILVEVERGRTLLDVIALEQNLEELLGRSVEVLTDAGLSPYLQHRILIEAASAVKDDRVYLQHIRDAFPGHGSDALWLMLRRGAPLNPGVTAALAALAVSALANVAACVAHPHTDNGITLIWHGATIGVFVTLAAVTGHLALKWDVRGLPAAATGAQR